MIKLIISWLIDKSSWLPRLMWLGLIFSLYGAGYQSGKHSQQQKVLKKQVKEIHYGVKKVRQARDTEESINTLPSSDLERRLQHGSWYRTTDLPAEK